MSRRLERLGAATLSVGASSALYVVPGVGVQKVTYRFVTLQNRRAATTVVDINSVGYFLHAELGAYQSVQYNLNYVVYPTEGFVVHVTGIGSGVALDISLHGIVLSQ